jgi:F0F1-type ATP synthase assembly protein I
VDNITKVLLAITTVALVATVVVNGKNSAAVVSAGLGGFSNSLSAAEKG